MSSTSTQGCVCTWDKAPRVVCNGRRGTGGSRTWDASVRYHSEEMAVLTVSVPCSRKKEADGGGKEK